MPKMGTENIDSFSQDADVKNIFVEYGSTGLTRFGGFLYEEWLKDLQGKRGALTYREMSDNDAVIGAFLYALEMLIRQVKWRVDPAEDTPQDQEAKDFVEECLYDMTASWSDTLSEILTFLPFGWSMLEVCYKKRSGPKDQLDETKSKYTDGRIGWTKWAIRAQETLWKWRFSETGVILGMEQTAPPDYALRFIPIQKCLLFRTKSNKNNPEGRSILRNAYRSWYFKKNIEEIEAIGIERDLAGLPVMWLPPEIISPQSAEAATAYNQYKKIITNIRRDEQEGLMMPLVYDEKGNKTYDIELMSAGGSKRQFDTTQIISRYEQRIAMTVMADFLLLGDKGGSYALSVNKTSLFLTALKSILQNIADEINTHAIPKLIELNAFQGLSGYPKLCYNEVEKIDLAALGDFIQKTTGSGAITPSGDEDLENYLREAASLPKKSEVTQPVIQPKQPEVVEQPKVTKSNEQSDREIFLEAVKELRNQIRKGE